MKHYFQTQSKFLYQTSQFSGTKARILIFLMLRSEYLGLWPLFYEMNNWQVNKILCYPASFMNDNDSSFTIFIQSFFPQENMSDRIKLSWFSCFWKNFHIHNVHGVCKLHNHNHVVCILHIHIHDDHSCSCIHSHSWDSCNQHPEEDNHCIHNHQSVWSEKVCVELIFFVF